jgi:hypothetical protein
MRTSSRDQQALNDSLLQLRDELIRAAENRLTLMALPKDTAVAMLWGAALKATIDHGAEESLLNQIQHILQPLIVTVKLKQIRAAEEAKEDSPPPPDQQH